MSGFVLCCLGGLFVLWVLALRAPARRKVSGKNGTVLRSMKAHFRSQEECLLTAAGLLHASRVGLPLAPDAISRKSLRPPVGDALALLRCLPGPARTRDLIAPVMVASALSFTGDPAPVILRTSSPLVTRRSLHTRKTITLFQSGNAVA